MLKMHNPKLRDVYQGRGRESKDCRLNKVKMEVAAHIHSYCRERDGEIERERGRGFTSCKINANEKTSTLVSYSSFLKTSGATYRPAQNK